MSGVKILALGVLAMAIAPHPASGGSIHSPDDQFRLPARWIATPAPQNLANPSSNPGNESRLVAQAGNQPSAPGLVLGVTSAADPAVFATAGQSPTSGASVSQTFASASSPAPASAPADAFINFGSGPYPEASSLITGNAQPFFTSPAFTHLFGAGGPTSTDITNFEHEVIGTIQKTYNGAGLPITLTTDPTATAAHTMSVISGASWVGSANAIGITDVGHDGFSFIDKFSAATTVDQLATAIGHNLSHELMHAFGIANHPEQSGPYVDAASSTLATLSDPSTSFSPIAAQLLSTLDFQAVGRSVMAGTQDVDGNQILVTDPTPVPEPTALALWGSVGGLFIAYRRRVAA